LTAPHQKAP